MNLSQHTVLVTGGASGIGLALAAAFLNAGSEVIACGRREDKLKEAQRRHPSLRIRVCDVARESERVALHEWAVRSFPKLDVLVNNAGQMRQVQLAEPEPWEVTSAEIRTNLDAPIHLTRLVLPHLLARESAAIVNVTSGLAFVPLAVSPVYCATKAGLHSFTLSLRRQLAGTKVEAIEIAPPHVNTDLGAPGRNTAGMPLADFIAAAVRGLERGDAEITTGFSEKVSRASRAELDEVFARMNQAVH
jgi:uncharacterized oxidoreductase